MRRGGPVLESYSELLANRPYRTLLLAGTFSFAAPTTALIVLQSAVARYYTGGESGFSALALAALGLAATVPTLVAALFSGALADRYDRRWLLKLTGFVALGATVLIALLLSWAPRAAVGLPGPPGFAVPVWLLLALPLWAALTAAVTVFRPTFNAALPQLVETHQLGSANSLLYAVTVGAGAATQLLVGLVYQVSTEVAAFAIPVALFALSQLFLYLLGAGPSSPRGAPRRAFLAEATEGYRYLLLRRELLAVTVGSLAVNFLAALAFVELAQYSAFYLGENAAFLGALYGVGTLGAGIGAVVINRFHFERHLGRVIAVLIVGMGGSVAGFALTHSPAVALADMLLFGMFPGMIQIGFIAGVQATVPNQLLGRVFAADEVGSYAFVPVGQYVGGTLTFAAGIGTTYLSAGIGMAAVGAGMFLTPAVGRFRYDPRRRPRELAPDASGASAPSASSTGSDEP